LQAFLAGRTIQYSNNYREKKMTEGIYQQGYCTGCGLTRDQRMKYEGACPAVFPKLHCPFYDKPQNTGGQDEGLDHAFFGKVQP
jgi:hypothetical protein